ncbi:hypothetical protein CL1_1890 [Thermococcus cleftensis]|uniref:Uncharacterized protein n=1 Tax=Thermococcus cleftensis (strain DSM 27260 / KACC 17922 / CL1) TaxID=163003 RepID=I3ZWK1_THECF|nr:hypothetical protein [Thermococcus cleftensis]AFL96085.1 hypothetical protein CL1_1890 [Thermococcus cleftensis]
MEIEVTDDGLKEIRKNRREIEARFRNLEGLERTLRVLKLRFLIEQRERVKKRLIEMKANYEELIEFEEMAKLDKRFLMAFRKELSEENKRLRAGLEGRKR